MPGRGKSRGAKYPTIAQSLDPTGKPSLLNATLWRCRHQRLRYVAFGTQYCRGWDTTVINLGVASGDRCGVRLRTRAGRGAG